MKHRKQNSDKTGGRDEWLSPPEIVFLVRYVMGGIDCDPASCKLAQTYIKAKVYYSKDEDGLTKRWNGRVFMNPPYSRALIGKFVQHLLTDGCVTEYITLTNNSTATKWGQMLIQGSELICFMEKRIQFLSPVLEDHSGSPLQGQMMCYRGPNKNKFKETFGNLGIVLQNEKSCGIFNNAFQLALNI